MQQKNVAMTVRNEESSDGPAVDALLRSAFESESEAQLVARLRSDADGIVSLVAEIGDKAVGYIMFSPMRMINNPELDLMGLAPLAVLPDYQRQGVGSTLTRVGLKECEERRVRAVFVLGHPNYYPRFGFQPATKFGIHCQFPVPGDVFMVKELLPGGLDSCSGLVRYHPEFDEG